MLFLALDRELPLHPAIFRIRPPQRAALLPHAHNEAVHQRLLHTVLHQTT
ncbi:MAG: hypothetical protein R3C14_53035 [Caldilineaceae bacterium]